MKVWFMQPYSTERNLGKAYNEYLSLIPDGDSVCFTDGDSMMLLPNWGHVIQIYAEQNPNAVLTCYINRIHELATGQLYKFGGFDSSDVRVCLQQATVLNNINDFNTTSITGSVSGTLLVLPKHIWKKHPFSEVNLYKPGQPNLLGVDNEMINRIRANGIQVLRMDSVLIYHQYRLLSGTKQHLL